MLNMRSITLIGIAALTLAACSQEAAERSADTLEAASADSEPAALPAAVNGWIEHPLKDGVIRVQPVQWRTDTIEIPLPANGGDLEYKLAMKHGDAVVYSIDYGRLNDPGVIASEFHGHTEKRADGIGDLMFYSKTGGTAQSGQFVAPWNGVHGWYLKNNSSEDAVVTLRLAGFYALVQE